MNASTRLLQSLLDHGDYLERLSRDEIRAILPILESAHERILGKIAKTNGAWTKEWLTEIAQDASAIYEAASAEAYKAIEGDLNPFARKEAGWIRDEVGALLYGAVSLTAPSPDLLKSILALPTSVEGATLGQLFDALAYNSRAAVISAIQDGALSGDTVQQMIQRLRGSVVRRASWRTIDGRKTYIPGKYEGGVIENISTVQARALARTAVMHVSNQARQSLYDANADIIKGYQRVETLDGDTCIICGADDGHVYGMDEVKPDLPIHPACRGVYCPVLKSWKELGIDAEEFPEGTRASMDGQVPESTTYADRLAKASPEKQREMLGPGRYALYQRGVPITDMVEGNRLIPLAQMTAPRKRGAA